ncbi:sulfotransferase family 5A, member 1 [Danio aesculapii]|uniref:sulfotransferase family 5A, member 1 n=1 Tax=Danio aesculapii TaxID=1142201 RepID=UPI0024C04068|nr:sulfotransferase family 5A, member 1 [Danio aesculapii]
MSRLDVTESFQGIMFPGHMHTEESLNFATNFKFEDTDTLIVTYPKSGTTWMQEILTLVLSKGDPTIAQSQPNWARAPWLEQYYCPEVLIASSGPRIITTHLAYHLLAPALQHCKAKVIYVARNVKDVCVSYYHFHKMANFLPDPGTFPEFLKNFLKGEVHYGSWFDHVNGWTSHAKDFQNFFYITYEEMFQDLRGSLQKVSHFLHCTLHKEELNLAEKHCSFNSMKENAMVNYTLIPKEIIDHSKGKFMRKGKVGDWKNMFTKEQSGLVDEVYFSQMADSSLLFQRDCPGETLVPLININNPASREILLLT